MLGNITFGSADEGHTQSDAAKYEEMKQRLHDVEARSLQLQSENQYFKEQLARVEGVLCKIDAKFC